MMGALLEWMVVAFIVANAAVITSWMAGAIYYDVCRDTSYGWLAATIWLGGVLLLFAVWRPLWQPFAVLLGVAVLFFVCWLRQKPSHDRDWDPAVAVLPRAAREGDVVKIENLRNF